MNSPSPCEAVKSSGRNDLILELIPPHSAAVKEKARFMTRMMMMWMFGVPLTVMLLLMVFGIL